jgi:hypothetical protein
MLAKALNATGHFGGSIGTDQLPNLSKRVTLLFVKLFGMDVLPRLVNCTLLALSLTLLDFTMDDIPIYRRAVLTELPFLELTLILALAVDELGAWPRT